mgnify:CR=1 FL=1
MNICGVDSYLTKITFVKKQKKKSSSFHEKGETLWVYVVCSMYWPAQRKFPQHLFIGETETETETEQERQRKKSAGKPKQRKREKKSLIALKAD